MPDGMQEDESGQQVSYRVAWTGGAHGRQEVVRRNYGPAVDLAKRQRDAGFTAKLFRVEETELDF